MVIIKLKIKYRYKKGVGLNKLTLPSCFFFGQEIFACLFVCFSLVGFSDFAVCVMFSKLVCFLNVILLSYFVF